MPLGDTAATGDTEKYRSRSGGDRRSLSAGGDNESTHRNCPSRAGNSFAVPAVAQKKDAVDPQILEQLATLALELIYLVLTVW